MQSIRLSAVVLSAAFLFLIPVAAEAAPTDLDPAFGTGGFSWVTTNAPYGDAYPYGSVHVHRFSSGGFVSLDDWQSSVSNAQMLTRVDADGHRVAGFGTDGLAVVEDNPTSQYGFNDVVETNEGHLLVVGTDSGAAPAKAVAARFDSATGAADSSYYGTGRKLLDSPGGNKYVASARRCSVGAGGDGICVLEYGGSGAAAIEKLSAAGEPTGASISLILPPGYSSYSPQEILPAGDRLYLSGAVSTSAAPGTFRPAVLAVDSGGLVSEWGDHGVELLDLAAGRASQMAMNSAGQVVVVLNGVTLSRLTSTGELDTTFAGGYRDCEPAPCHYGSLAVGPSGEIVAAGRRDGQGTLVSRFTANGDPDPTFTPEGWHTFVAGSNAVADATADFVDVDSGGRIVVRNTTDHDALNDSHPLPSAFYARLIGTPPPVGTEVPVVAPAKAKFAASLRSRLKAKKAKTIKGTATGTSLTKVEVAIQRPDTKLLRKSKKCAYIKSTKLGVKKIKAVKRKCVPGVWIKASGTATWSLKLKKALKPGKYVLSVRATGAAGIGAITTKKVTLTK